MNVTAREFKTSGTDMISPSEAVDNSRYNREFGLFDSVFHEVSDAILIISAGDQSHPSYIEDINHQFELFTGYSLEDVRGTDLYTYFADHIPESKIESIARALESRQSAIFYCHWKCRNGDVIDVNMTIRPISSDDECPRFICVLRESRTEKNTRDEAAREIKQKLLAAMHHNFRTPLNGILGYSEVIMTEMLGPIGKDSYREYAKDIHGAGQNLLFLIDNLLDLKELETTEFELLESMFDLDDLINDCLAVMSEPAARKDIILKKCVADNLPLIHGDRERLEKVIYSLLENSLKFTPVGGTICLCASQEKDGTCLITCQDSGSGMTAQQVAKAFSHDSHLADIYSNPTTGIGFGLAYVKKLIEKHDGTVSIASSPESGTTVYVHLPAERMV